MRWKRSKLQPHGRGRPAQRSDRSTRQGLLALIELLGPGIGVPTLQAICPGMARREVRDMLRRYRRIWKRRRGLLTLVLHWQKPGSVWAIDFAEPPLAVDGCYDRLLAVRDLASGMQLLWLPVSDESAQTAIAALKMLFRQHGPPLVVKSDNGSGFIAGETRKLLVKWRVRHLRSPPEWPEYNGACEAGIGSMKARTHHRAAQNGHPGEWSCDDVEAARLQANQTARPWGLRGPTPEESWRQRRTIEVEERVAFGSAVNHLEAEARYASSVELDRSQVEAIKRAAIGKALVAQGLLKYRRGVGSRRARNTRDT